MRKNEPKKNKNQEQVDQGKSLLEEIIREGARKLLQSAIEKEITDYMEKVNGVSVTGNKKVVVRNGFAPKRSIMTGIGPICIQQPRIRDRWEKKEVFTSSILPRYLRGVPSLDNLIPVLYLKGVSTGDFTDALGAILGDNAKGLSANTIVRLKKQWEEEYQTWTKRSLKDKRYAYFWADGINFTVRLEDPENRKQCMLVIIGAGEDGSKELVGILDGYRESKLSWMDLLSDLRERGLTEGPALAVGDGGLGFWAAIQEIYPGTQEQRCWVHKTANILDKMPKGTQPKAKERIHDIYRADTRQQAIVAMNAFVSLYGKKFPNACECLTKDTETLLSFYNFPAEHWIHIRSTNVIESTFATVRLRTDKTRGCGTRLATLTMVFKLAREAQKTWHKMKGYRLIPKVINGDIFIDGENRNEEEQVA